jgi:hypothetical protein
MNLTDTERDAIAAKFWDGHELNNRAATWHDMTLAEQKSCAAEWQKQQRAAPGPAFTAEQGKRISDVLCAALPKLLRGFVREGALEQRLAALEAKLIGAISDSLGAIENSVLAKSAPGGESLADLGARVGKTELDVADVKNGLLSSHQRQISRHASHLSGLESRVKAIERKE